jgi:hypothetical protein
MRRNTWYCRMHTWMLSDRKVRTPARARANVPDEADLDSRRASSAQARYARCAAAQALSNVSAGTSLE